MKNTAAGPLPPATPDRPADTLTALKEEIFALETDRLEGRIGGTEYTALREAFDLVLKRALARQSQAVVKVVPE